MLLLLGTTASSAALSEFGKPGTAAIGISREGVEAFYEKTLRIHDRETSHGRSPRPRKGRKAGRWRADASGPPARC